MVALANITIVHKKLRKKSRHPARGHTAVVGFFVGAGGSKAVACVQLSRSGSRLQDDRGTGAGDERERICGASTKQHGPLRCIYA